MKLTTVESEGHLRAGQPRKQTIDTRRLGHTLRAVYEGSVDTQPITDTQVDLLLRLRQKSGAAQGELAPVIAPRTACCLS